MPRGGIEVGFLASVLLPFPILAFGALVIAGALLLFRARPQKPEAA